MPPQIFGQILSIADSVFRLFGGKPIEEWDSQYQNPYGGQSYANSVYNPMNPANPYNYIEPNTNSFYPQSSGPNTNSDKTILYVVLAVVLLSFLKK